MLPPALHHDLERVVAGYLQGSIKMYNTRSIRSSARGSIVAAVDALDALIGASLARIWTAVYAQLNELVPINVLPNELICAIAQSLPLADKVAMTHVCGRWRRVLLADPNQWDRISVGGPRTTRTLALHALPVILKRTRDLPVFLSVDVASTCNLDKTWRTLGTHLPHVAALSLYSVSARDSEKVASVLGLHSPLMERLEVRVRGINKLRLTTDALTILGKPRLAHLALENVSMPRAPLPLVRHMTFDDLFLSSPNEIGQLLEDAPNLRSLSLRVCWSTYHPPPRIHPRHNLDKLELTCNYTSHALWILQLLRAHTIRDVTITVTGTNQQLPLQFVLEHRYNGITTTLRPTSMTFFSDSAHAGSFGLRFSDGTMSRTAIYNEEQFSDHVWSYIIGANYLSPPRWEVPIASWRTFVRRVALCFPQGPRELVVDLAGWDGQYLGYERLSCPVLQDVVFRNAPTPVMLAQPFLAMLDVGHRPLRIHFE
ncbi:hypothetical protein EXIGLDRAFT_837873 [Exidia glandulosa HHB12029]|uniref:F-box domain-containing protein n=1 Tax=Exidia glandulosa HHB12029 TaxID=1314781 RepID=A0A166ABD5_EXIGL|nr:hypothetical protein EXIGLDRAFT_837873 [Exidia glandulosa HHB12029]